MKQILITLSLIHRMKNIWLVLFCLFGLKLYANEFLEGTYEGLGFSVEKDGQLLFSDSMAYSHSSNLEIKKLSSDTYKFIVNVEIQPKKNSKKVTDRRVDNFDVIWRSETEGKLVNKNSKHKGDECRFSYESLILKIDCWTQKHKTWEKQAYQHESKATDFSSSKADELSFILTTFCISSRLNVDNFILSFDHAEKNKTFQKQVNITKQELNLANPDADEGYKILWENKPYFVLFGERDASAGGAFCSVMTNLDYEEAKNEISQNFTTANLIKEDIIGPNNIAIYKSNFPGLPPVILSVQSAHGMSSFSIYKQ